MSQRTSALRRPLASKTFPLIRVAATAAAIFALTSVLSGCGGGVVGDWLPHSMGGLPKDAPPRAGTPEYDAWQEKIRGKAPAEPGSGSKTSQ